MAPRETENNAYAKFWGDKQRTLCYVMVFLEWSIDLVLMQAFLFSSVDYVVRIFNGKKWRQRKAPL